MSFQQKRSYDEEKYAGEEEETGAPNDDEERAAEADAGVEISADAEPNSGPEDYPAEDEGEPDPAVYVRHRRSAPQRPAAAPARAQAGTRTGRGKVPPPATRRAAAPYRAGRG